MTVKWFMPGITELEDVLTTYYSNFPEFQNYFYWSISAAKTKGGFLNLYTVEATDYARATKVVNPTASNTDDRYAKSGSTNSDDNFTGHNGTKGRAPRSTILRIRACYK